MRSASTQTVKRSPMGINLPQHTCKPAGMCLSLILGFALSIGGVTATYAQIYTQNFNAFAVGLGISGNNGVACDASAADGTITQTLGGITWELSGSFTDGGASTDECDYVKVVQAGAGNRRLRAKDLNGNQFRYRTSGIDGSTGINITGQAVTVALLVGVQAGTLEVDDEVTVQITVDGNLEYDTTFTGNFANQNISVPGLIGDELFLDVFFRNGDAGGATGESEAHFLDNISITGTPCQPALTILGPGTPCAGSTEVYSISSPPVGHTLTWSLSSGGSITPTVDGDSATVVWNTGISGSRTITVVDVDPETGCTTTNNRNVTLQQGPGVSPLSNIGPFCPEVNVGGISLNTIPFSTTVSFEWTVSNPVTGLTDGTDNTFPYEIPAFVTDNNTGSQQVSTVSVVAVSSAGCAGIPEEFTITVNPAPDLNLVGEPAVCSGNTFDLGTLINNNEADGEVVDANNIPSLGFLVYTSTEFIPANQLLDLEVSPAASTPYYFVKPTAAGCNDFIEVILEVQGPITTNFLQGTVVICEGGSTNLTSTAGNDGDGDLLYQWQVNDGMGWTDITDGGIYSGATTATLSITGATLAEDANDYRVSVSTSACPAENSNEVALTVFPKPDGEISLTVPGLKCSDTSFDLTFTASVGTGPFTIIVNGLEYPNVESGDMISVTGSAPSTTFNLTSITDALGCTLEGEPISSVSVDVNQLPVVAIDELTSFCVGVTLEHTATIDPAAPAHGAYGYVWEACASDNCTTCNTSGFSPNNTDASPTRLWNTIAAARSVSLGITTPGCATVVEDCEDFSIVADPVAPAIAKNPDAVVCEGATLTISVTTPGSGGAGTCVDEYRYSTDNGANWSEWSDVLPSFEAALGAVNLVESRRNCDASGCNSNVNQISWTAVADPVAPVIAKDPDEPTVCPEVTLTIIVTTPGSGGTGTCVDEYRYSTDGGANWSDWSAVLPSFSSVTGTNLVQSRRNCDGSGCDSNIDEVSWTVEPGPEVDNILAMVCSDEPIGVVLGESTNAVEVYSYTVAVSDDGGLTPSNGPSTGPTLDPNAIMNDAWTNTSTDPVDVVYTITPANVAGCVGPDFTVTISIKPEPEVDFQTGMACSDTPIGITLGNGTNILVTTYEITDIDSVFMMTTLTSSAGNPGTGAGFNDDAIADDAWTNTSGGDVPVIYMVVPTGANGCEGDLFTVTVTIKPEPVVDDQEVTVCSDEIIDVDFGSGMPGRPENQESGERAGGGPVYTVTSLVLEPGLVADPGNVVLPTSTFPVEALASNAIANDTYTNTTSGPLTATYMVIPFGSNGCAGDTFTIVVIVNPEPVVADQTAMACSDEEIGVIFEDDEDGPAAFTYSIIDISIDLGLTPDPGNLDLSGLPTPISGLSATAIQADQYTNQTNGPLTVTYKVIPVSEDGCEGDSFTVTVTIKPEPVLVAPGSPINVCSDEPLSSAFDVGDFLISNGIAIDQLDLISVTFSNLANFTPNPGNVVPANGQDLDYFLNDSYTNKRPGGVQVTYRVVVYSEDGCPGDPVDIVFQIRSEPVLASDLNTMVCSDEPVGVTLAIDPGIGFQTVTGYDIISITPDGSLVGDPGNAIVGDNQPAGAIAGDIWTNTTAGILNVVYQIAPRRPNGCVGDTIDVTIMIKPEPVVENQEGMACSDVATGMMLGNDGDGPAAATYNITAINPNGLSASAGSPAVGNGLAANVIADDAWSNLTNASVEVIYTVVPVSEDGCEGDPFTVTVLIKPEPSVLFQELMVCSDEPLDLLLGDDPDGPSVAFYNITNINPNGLTPGFGNATTGPAQPQTAITDDTWTNIGTGTVNVIYTVIPTGSNGCVGEAFAVTVMVKPEPIVENQTATVCSDEPINVILGNDGDGPTAISYEIVALTIGDGLTSNPGNLDLSSLPVTGLGEEAIKTDSYNNETNEPITVIYTVIPVSADGCGGDPFTVTVTINPEPVVENQDDGACSDEPIGVLLPEEDEDGLVITSYDITVSIAPELMGVPTVGMGITDVNAIAANEYTNLTNGPLDVVYTVTPSADGCPGEPFTITVTISPEPLVANIPTFSVCSDDPIGYVLPAMDDDGLAITSYDISASVDPNLTGTATTGTGITDVNAITSDSFTNLTGGGQTVVYTITPYANGCAGASFTVTVNVRAEPVLDPDLDAMVCSDEPIGVILDNDNTIGFQTVIGYDIISITPDGGLVGDPGNAVVGNNQPDNAIAGDMWTNTTSGVLNVIYRVAPRRNNGCVGDEVDITVMIKPEPVVDNQTGVVCSDAPTGITLGNDVDGPSVSSYNITDITSNGLTASAGSPATGNGLVANVIANDAWTNATNASVDVVYTVVPVSADGCEGDPFTVTVTIQPEPVVAFQTLTVCSDEVLDLTLGNDPNGPSVAFYDITGINANGLTASAGNPTTGMGLLANEIADDAWTNITNAPVDVIYALIPYGSNGCPGNPFAVTVTVKPEPVVENQTSMACSDVSIGVVLPAVDDDGLAITSYDITAVVDGALTGVATEGTGITDVNALIMNAFTNTTGDPLDVVYTVTPYSMDCPGAPFTITVTIKPEPVVENQEDGACSDEAIGVVLGESSSVPVTTYNIVDITSNGLMASAGSPAVASMVSANEIADDAWTNPGITPVDVVYTVVPVSAEGCEGDAFTVTVTISAEPVVADQVEMACSDVAINVVLNDDPDGPAVTSYNITDIETGGLMASDGNPVTGDGFDANEIADDAWTNTTNAPVDVVYTIVPVSDGCEGDKFTVTVTIKPEPVVEDQTAMACSDVTIGVTLGASTSVAAATYNITNIESNGLTASAGAPATGNGLSDSEIANDAWTNTTNAPVDVVYTVVPVSADGCEGDPFTVTVTIKPEPVVANQAQSICSDVPNGLILGASTSVPAATYNITNIVNNGLLATAGAPMTGNGLAANVIADDAWRNQGINPVNVVYTVVPVSADGCEGNAFTVTLTVAPEPVLDVPGAPITVCSDSPLSSEWGGITTLNGQVLSYINLTDVTDNTASPNFTADPGNAAFPANAVPVNYFDNDIYTNLTAGAVIVSYDVVAVTPGGCASDPVTYEFQIRAEPVLSPDLDTTVCSGAPVGVVFSLDPTIGYQTVTGYNVVSVVADPNLLGGPGTTGNNLPANAIAADAWINPTDGPLTVVYTVVPRRGGGPCFGDAVEVTVTIEPYPVAAVEVTAGGNPPVEVNADLYPAGTPYMLMVCSDEEFSAQAISTVVPTPGRDLWLQVAVSDPANVLGNGPAFTILAPYGTVAFNNSIHNETNAPYTITATFTPFINFNGDQVLDPEECVGDAFELQIVIKPEPVAVATPSATELCDDEPFTIDLDDNGSSEPASFFDIFIEIPDGLTQTNGTPSGASLPGPTNTITGEFSNNTTGTLTVTYTIIPVSIDGCPGDTITVEIDIFARPSTDPGPDMICKGTTATIMPNVTLGSAAISSYKWTYLGTTASNFRINGGPLLNPASPTGTMYTTTNLSINTTSPLVVVGLIGFELVVTDANGCTSEPVEVYIEIKPVPNAGTNGSFGPICETFGNINLFSLLGGTPEPGGTWTANMGNPAGGTLVGPNFNPAGSVGGVYMFTYTIDNGACDPVSSTVTVTVNPNANAGTFDIGADNDVCEDEPSFNLFTLLTGTAGVNYDAGGTWAELTSSGAGLNPATGELDLTTALPGNYTFRYTVTVGPTACPNPTDFEEVTLNILELPAPNPILGNEAPCVNASANYTLTTPVVVGVTRVWSISGGGTITTGTTGDNISVTWGNVPGTYTVTCVETRLGCSTTNTLDVEVTATVAGFTWAPASPDGLTIDFTDTSTGGAFNWFWDFDDSSTSGDQNPSHTFPSEGQYEVCLNVVGSCGVDQYCEIIDVVAVPTFRCDTVMLQAGLNLISIDVVPTDSTITNLFADILALNNLDYITGFDLSGPFGGATIFDPDFIPFSTLTEFERGFGFYVQMLAADTLIVCGESIDTSYRKDLDAGFNLVAYLPQDPQPVTSYLGDLISAVNLDYAIGFDLFPLIFDPDFIPFSTLTTVENGFGYGVQVFGATPGTGWRPTHDLIAEPTSVYDFVFGYSNLGPDAVGEKVRIFTEDRVLRGELEVISGGYLMTTALYGDLPHTQDLEEGILSGEKLLFEYNGQIVDPGVEFMGTMQKIILNLSFDLTTGVADVVDQLLTCKIFPNPVSDEGRIQLNLVQSGKVRILLRDVKGALVGDLYKGNLQIGESSVEFSAQNLSAGTYDVLILLDGKLAHVERLAVVRN